jgi:DNA-binding MarR family transcriptional regulator
MEFFDQHSDPVASRVAIGLNKLGLAIKSQAWLGAGQRGITPTQGQILVLLRSRGRLLLRLTEVAELLAISPPTASDSVRALVRKGLVKKTRAAHDARAVALELTPEGCDEAQRAASWPDFLLRAIHTLTEPEQEAFLVALIKMIGALIEDGQIPMQRMCVVCRHFQANREPNRDPPHHCTLVDAPLGRRHLRLDCPDHEVASEDVYRGNLLQFASVERSLIPGQRLERA